MPMVADVEGARRRKVVFIGPMGSGKTAVGEAFAAATQQKFVDTDRIMAAAHGSIRSIFASRGEAWFRGLEARTVAQCLDSDEYQIVSLGGGAVLDSGTQQLLAAAVVIFLYVDADTVAPRLRRGAARPLLSGDTMERWKELLEQRLPVYRRLADVEIDARGKSVPALVQELGLILTEDRG